MYYIYSFFCQVYLNIVSNVNNKMASILVNNNSSYIQPVLSIQEGLMI